MGIGRIDPHGVFFSASMLDSNEDDPRNVVFVIECEAEDISVFEIIEADCDHRKYSIPADVANTLTRRRLSTSEARKIPVVDRANDPAYPFANESETDSP